jgi:hypothetical protein
LAQNPEWLNNNSADATNIPARLERESEHADLSKLCDLATHLGLASVVAYRMLPT